MTQSSQRSLENFFILQLYKEYDHILYSYKIKMGRPLLQLKENRSHYGSWCPKTRSITLAWELVEKYPWAYTLEILKHEMAHQFVSEVMKAPEHHGPLFQEACHNLRVEPWARKACLNLDQCLIRVKDTGLTQQENQALRRVKKLLQLATSSNRNESLQALKKAAEIAEAHHISLTHTEDNAKLSKLTIPLNRKKTHTYETLISSLLSSHFNVMVIHSSLFDKERMREEKTLEILGDKQSVAMAEYVFVFLSRKLESLWREHKSEENCSGLRAKNAFFFGVLDGYLEQLNESRKPVTLNQSEEKRQSLIRKEKQKALTQFSHYHFPRTISNTSRSYRVSSSEYREGFKKGKKLTLRDPLTSHGKRKLIGP